MASKTPGGGGGFGRGSSGSVGRAGKAGTQKKVVSISTKKALTPAQIKARELKARVDRVKKSEAAQDLRNKNLNNFNKKFDRKPRPAVTKKNNSPFGPVAAGIVKPKPKPKGKK
jgi:ribosomal protein S30